MDNKIKRDELGRFLKGNNIKGRLDKELKMKPKFFFLTLTILLVLPLIFAQTYEQNTNIDLKIPFEVNGSFADATAVCNISIDYPNATNIFENKSMTNIGSGRFNITLIAEQTNQLGGYDWVAFCCEGSDCAAGYGSFEVTPSGSDAISSGEGISLSLAIFSILIIAIVFFVTSFKVKFVPIKIFFMGFAIVFFMVALIFTMITFSEILGGYEKLVGGYVIFYWLVLFMIVIITIFMLLVLIKNAIEMFKTKRGLR